MTDGLITGQLVDPAKIARAREFRRHMTAEESMLWHRLRAHRFHGLHFRRQQVLLGFIVDFYCDVLKLVVEVDGPVHETQCEADSIRDEILRARGLRVVRFTNDEVRQDVDEVLERIGALRSLEPPASPSSQPSQQTPSPLPLTAPGRGPGG